MAAGLSPEYVVFNKLWGMRSAVHVYLMRPEAVEAFFVMWRLTGNTKYREYGWGVFQAIEKWCKVTPLAQQQRQIAVGPAILSWLLAMP